MASPLVLVVDDEPDLVELVTLTLRRMQLATLSAGDVAGAKKLLKSQRFDLCLTDMRLPDGDGLDLLEWITVHCPGVPCAVITAHGNVEAARPRRSAPHRHHGAQAVSIARYQRLDTHRYSAHRQRPVDGPAARNDPACLPQPGAGPHFGRIRDGQRTRRTDDSRLRSARRRPVRAGELRRDSFGAHGKRILR